MKIRSLIIALTASLIAPAAFGQAPTSADIMTVVDESGSMNTEHAWLPGMITALETGLTAAGIGTAPDENQYSLTGFGSSQHAVTSPSQGPHSHQVGGSDWFGASDYGLATPALLASGGWEDGYAAIAYSLALSGQTAGAATNVILVTDEDRDVRVGASTFATTLTALTNANALLNVVVNASFSCFAGSVSALGIDSAGNGYIADGAGGFDTCADGAVSGGSGTTIADYVVLALATGGAAWDLNQLRAGGLTADSFTAAFVDIKVQEITQQTLPEPSTLALLGLGLFGFGAARRRRTQ